MAEGVAFIGEQYLPADEAKISVFDLGFSRSDAVYDVVSAWKGIFFRLDDHVEPALLPVPPDVGRLAAQGGFVEIAVYHDGNYILHLFSPHAKIEMHNELSTDDTEKWATPTFLLVIRSLRSNRHG